MIICMVVLLTTMLLGLPIAFSVGLAALAYFAVADVSLMILAQKVVGQLSVVPLLAVPFFILAGELMNRGGITIRIFLFALAIIGRIPGCLGYANVLASMVFAGISGSSVADVAGLGKVEMAAMRRHRYPDDLSIGVTVSSSVVGGIIPPSINAVIFGSMAAVPIGPLFLAGVFPGVLAGLLMMVTFGILFARRGAVADEVEPIRFFGALRHSFGALLTPIVLLGSMFTGVATPTEAAVLACVYATVLSGIVYRELSLAEFLGCVLRSAVLSGAVLLMIGFAAPLGYMVARDRVAAELMLFLIGTLSNPTVLVLSFLVLMLVVGMFLEVAAAIILLTPIIYPAMIILGYDPVHIGIIIVFGLGIGLITPPIGLCLFVGSQISGMSLQKVSNAASPYIVSLIIVLLITTFIPQFSLLVPQLVYGR